MNTNNVVGNEIGLNNYQSAIQTARMIKLFNNQQCADYGDVLNWLALGVLLAFIII